MIALYLLFLCSGVSHSVTSDMHIIQQENPLGAKTNKGRRFTEEDDDDGSFSSRSDEDRRSACSQAVDDDSSTSYVDLFFFSPDLNLNLFFL